MSYYRTSKEQEAALNKSLDAKFNNAKILIKAIAARVRKATAQKSWTESKQIKKG